jgi:hypothetical protein
MLKSILFTAALATLLLVVAPAQGQQCDLAADSCSSVLFPFNSDGQYYRAQLFPGETARLKLTFYEGIVYRLIPCGRSKTGDPLIITLYDTKGNKLFTNEAQSGEPFFDFAFGATSDYTVVARFKKGSGCAALLVGFQDDEDDD